VGTGGLFDGAETGSALGHLKAFGTYRNTAKPPELKLLFRSGDFIRQAVYVSRFLKRFDAHGKILWF
jgi:hypothetical protein